MTGCVVLLSLGRHPVSDRARLAPDEAAAISLAVRAGLSPALVYAGPAISEPVLRRGLGLGAAKLAILAIGPEEDPVEPLCDWLAAEQPEIVVTGMRAETGEGSGMLPHLLAARLRRPLVSDCTGLEQSADGAWIAWRAVRGGSRRLLGLSGPAILAVGPRAAPASLGSHALAWRGAVRQFSPSAARDPRHENPLVPARAVPPPLHRVETELAGAARTVTCPDDAATAILEFLRSAR